MIKLQKFCRNLNIAKNQKKKMKELLEEKDKDKKELFKKAKEVIKTKVKNQKGFLHKDNMNIEIS